MLASLGVYDFASIRSLTQEDPIGLAGGLNLYGYAAGDPVNFSDPFGLCPDHLETEPCAPGTIVWHNFGRGEASAASNSELNNFAEGVAGWMGVAIVIKSADRTGNPGGSSDQSNHRTDLGGQGALDLHAYNQDGSMVPDGETAEMMAAARDLSGADVSITQHLEHTNTTGPHVHIEPQKRPNGTKRPDRTETRGQYTPTTHFEP